MKRALLGSLVNTLDRLSVALQRGYACQTSKPVPIFVPDWVYKDGDRPEPPEAPFSFTPDTLREGTEYLRKVEPVFIPLIERYGEPTFLLPKKQSIFVPMLKVITYIKIPMQVGDELLDELREKCGGTLSAKKMSKLEEKDMSEIGYDEFKIMLIGDLVRKFVKHELVDESIKDWDDNRIKKDLTKVKGITEKIIPSFKMFHLGKPDELVADDKAIIKGFQKVFKLQHDVDEVLLSSIAEAWTPFRSIGAYYMWKVGGPKLNDLPWRIFAEDSETICKSEDTSDDGNDEV